MSDSFATPWTAAHQAPLSKRFPRQKHWSGQPFPPLGDLSQPRDWIRISCHCQLLFIVSKWILELAWCPQVRLIFYFQKSIIVTKQNKTFSQWPSVQCFKFPDFNFFILIFCIIFHVTLSFNNYFSNLNMDI